METEAMKEEKNLQNYVINNLREIDISSKKEE